MQLKDLFEVESGNGLDLNKMTVSKQKETTNYVNFVSRTSKNQGIVARVKVIPDVEPFPAGLITVTLGGTYLLSSFVQQESFYTAEHMRVLKPRRNMTLQEKLYYCLCIKKNNFRYSAFGREADRTITTLEVPDNPPSWVIDNKTIATFQQMVISSL